MNRRVFIFSSGSLRRKDNTIYFKNKDTGDSYYLPIKTIKEIYIFGEVDFNKSFLNLISRANIIIHFFDYYENYIGSFNPKKYYNSGLVTVSQVEHYLDNNKRVFIARKIVEGTINASLYSLYSYNKNYACLDDLIDKLKYFKYKLDNLKSLKEVMALESNIKKNYYKLFDRVLLENFVFESRSRRPPKNPINTMMSFGNSLLYASVLSEISKTHLDSRIAYLHSSNERSHSLNLDIADIFKPIIVDRLIISLLNKKVVTEKDFTFKNPGVYLKNKSRKKMIDGFNSKLKTSVEHRGRKISYRNLIRSELYRLEDHVLGKRSYLSFNMR